MKLVSRGPTNDRGLVTMDPSKIDSGCDSSAIPPLLMYKLGRLVGGTPISSAENSNINRYCRLYFDDTNVKFFR